MAVLNLTPDSFYAGSRVPSGREALEAAEAAVDQGADILDLGAESTRPGSQPLSEEEERMRLLPALRAIRRSLPQTPISADTRHAETARQALEEGADIINDVTGMETAAMGSLLAARTCGAVLMHRRGGFHDMQRLPPLEDPVGCVTDGLQVIVARAKAAGVKAERVVLDPGFGFGKNLDENFSLLAHFAEWHSMGLPLLAGLSRKSFIGHALGDVPPEARLFGSLAACVAAVLAGAHLVRVHDVAPSLQAVKIADAILLAD